MTDFIPPKLFVIGVVLLIAVIAYSSQFFIFIPALGGWQWSSAKNLALLNALVLMVFYNYYLAVTTDPGRVPVRWEPPTIHPAPEKRSAGQTGPRFCKTCNVYKPPRTHHCRQCRRCVLKMDHHCPWINNCVGNNNYAHFLRFVLYVDMACIHVGVSLIWRIRCIMDDIRHFKFDSEPTTTEVVFLVINFVLTFIVIFCVGALSFYHIYCVCQNRSAIEAWEHGNVEKLIRRGKIEPVEYPFDVGLYRNICAVLGPNPLLWMWPQPAVGDGLTFPSIRHSDPYGWPPRDPDDLRPSIFSREYQRQVASEGDGQDHDDYYDSGSDSDYSVSNEETHIMRHIDRQTGPVHRNNPMEDTIPLSLVKAHLTRKKSPQSTKED